MDILYNDIGKVIYIKDGVIPVNKEIIFLIEESPEGGYEARALGYSIFTQGETYEEIKTFVRDAVYCHFEEEERPGIIRLHFVKDEVVAI